jgi:hypothetical protein
MAVNALPAKSCLIDGEAIITDKGTRRIRSGPTNQGERRSVLCAFDLIELNLEDLRPADPVGAAPGDRSAVVRHLTGRGTLQAF